MCIDLDLFGQVIVTFSDVELWLEEVTQVTPDNTPNRVKDYIKNYDVASKIAVAKLSGEFYKIQRHRKAFDINVIKSVFRQYVKPATKAKPEPCPAYFHRCENPLCAVFQANKSRSKNSKYNREKYHKKKEERAAWLESFAKVA